MFFSDKKINVVFNDEEIELMHKVVDNVLLPLLDKMEQGNYNSLIDPDTECWSLDDLQNFYIFCGMIGDRGDEDWDLTQVKGDEAKGDEDWDW